MKKLSVWILFVVVAGSLIMGCGGQKPASDSTYAQPDIIVQDSNESEEKNDTQAKQDDKDDVEAGNLQELTADQLKEAYLDFLNGKVKMKNKASDLKWMEQDKECTFEEMNEAFKADLEADFMESHITTSEYAFIDCGADGVPELALHQEFTFEVDAANQYSVFKYIDGQVCLVSSQYGYYRSFVSLNEYGYITYGGGSGANVYHQDVKYVNKDGEEVFLYSESDEMGLADAYVPTYSFPSHEAPEGYPEDIYAYNDNYATCISYSFEPYVYDEEKRDEEYYRNMFHSFYDIEGGYVAPNEELSKLYQDNGITFYELSEAEKKVRDHETSLGVTDQIREGDEITYISLLSDELANVSDSDDDQDDAGDENIVYVTNPSEEYYLSEKADNTNKEVKPLTLKQKSCVENQVTDQYEWFQKVGMQWDVDLFHSGPYTYSDENYLYEFTGIEEYGRTTQLAVYENGSRNYIKTFDFHDFVWAAGYEETDFVDRRITYAQISDNVLYINLYHRTYSETCPLNAYMMAIDFESGEVIWKSKPLVSNSDNFVIIGDAIVTGYGFTAEDHYLSIINRFTGEEIGHEKVKKSPDFFYYKDQVLYVRTYSYDYEFEVIN